MECVNVMVFVGEQVFQMVDCLTFLWMIFRLILTIVVLIQRLKFGVFPGKKS